MDKEQNRLWTVPFILVLFVNALNGISSYMVNPAMPEFLVSKGIPFALTGLISSLLSWVALAMRPFSGAMSDRFNKKKIMFVSYLATAACMLGYALVQESAAVIGVRILHGVAFAVSGTISMVFATSFVPEKRIAEGISYIGIASLLGTMIGPQLGSSISQRFGMGNLFLTAGGLCLICLFMIFVIPYQFVEQKGKRAGKKMTFSDFFAKELLIYVFLIGLFSFGNGIISYYLINFGEVRGIANIALFFTVYSVVCRQIAGCPRNPGDSDSGLSDLCGGHGAAGERLQPDPGLDRGCV
ncbi:MFS transporter [Holdemania filiformis]|uniref:MFS transporter n=1 Tax=Holdemania filiformis TaxID=61171 RepID=UPI00266FB652|nr:MFS transporter [Holdemania filiformis]